jgi:hypothetical protein
MQRDSIIEYAKRWKAIGINTFSLKIEKEHGSKKLYRKAIKISDEMLVSPDMLHDDFNFLGIFLKNSGIFCLDVESIHNSVDNFYSLLVERGIDPNSFLMEKSLNGGLHAYFRTGDLIIEDKHFNILNGIHFDILSNFRAFTSPSTFDDKRYEWIGTCFDNITGLDQIPVFPEELHDLIFDI